VQSKAQVAQGMRTQKQVGSKNAKENRQDLFQIHQKIYLENEKIDIPTGKKRKFVLEAQKEQHRKLEKKKKSLKIPWSIKIVSYLL
jgi:hypothetical protein